MKPRESLPPCRREAGKDPARVGAGAHRFGARQIRGSGRWNSSRLLAAGRLGSQLRLVLLDLQPDQVIDRGADHLPGRDPAGQISEPA